jgi:hypothetical protein
MHMVASTKDWFQERGRHKIYAGNRPMELPSRPSRSLPVMSHAGAEGEARGAGCGCH